jgi:ribonucleotide monophosphatase NagD (HAD superfamily)
VWWATNLDRTFPTEAGLLPGNGSFVRVVQETTGATPQVAGKPAASMMRAGTDLLGAARPLMVGDRLETDIAGARAAGITAGLVLTGVHREEDALAAPAERRPHVILDSLLDLLPDGAPRRFA